MFYFIKVLAVLTYIIIENCLGNLQNCSRHEKSSGDTGSDSLHLISFFLRHEQQIALHLYRTSPSLQMAALPLTFSLRTQAGQGSWQLYELGLLVLLLQAKEGDTSSHGWQRVALPLLSLEET